MTKLDISKSRLLTGYVYNYYDGGGLLITCFHWFKESSIPSDSVNVLLVGWLVDDDLSLIWGMLSNEIHDVQHPSRMLCCASFMMTSYLYLHPKNQQHSCNCKSIRPGDPRVLVLQVYTIIRRFTSAMPAIRLL